MDLLNMIDLPFLISECAPDIPPTVIMAIAEQESSLNPFAIGHPNYPPSKQPTTFGEAVRIADELTVAGARFDIGLMQINNQNFDWLGLDNVTALEPCANLRAAQRVILEGIRIEGKDVQSFFNSLSRYNSGNKNTGYNNGYVDGVAVKLLNHENEHPSTATPAPVAQKSQWSEIGNTIGLFTSNNNKFANSTDAGENNGNIFKSREYEQLPDYSVREMDRTTSGETNDLSEPDQNRL